MSEITKEDMIAEMDYLISISKKSKQISSPIGDHHVPLLRAIRHLIEYFGNLEDVDEIHTEWGIFVKIPKTERATSNGITTWKREVPEPSEEWIEKKAYKLFARLLTINGPFAEAQAMRDFIKEFLHNLIKELKENKNEKTF